MKKLLLIVGVTILGGVISLSWSEPPRETRREPPPVTCPTLDQLLKEKGVAEKEAQEELGRWRRQMLKDKLHDWSHLQK